MSCARRSRLARRGLRRAALLACALFAAAREAAADQYTLIPYGSLSEQYNDNVFFTKNPTEEYITSISIGLRLAHAGPRVSAALTAGNTAQIYARDTNDDDGLAAQFATVGATYALTPRLSLTAADAFNRVNRARALGSPLPAGSPSDPPPPTDPGSQAGLLLPRGSSLSNSVTLQAQYLFTQRLSGSVDYTNQFSNFTDPGATNMVNRAGIGLGYALAPAWTGTASYSFQRLDFSDAPDATTNNPALGVQWQIDPSWAAGGSLGVFVNETVGGGESAVPRRVGPTFQLYVNGAFERWNLDAGAGQQVTTSGGVAGLSVTPNVYLGASYQVLRNLTAYGNFVYSHFDTAETKYDSLQPILGLSWTINRYLAAGLSYAYRYTSNGVTTATLEAGSIDGNVAMISLTGSIDLWRTSDADVPSRL